MDFVNLVLHFVVPRPSNNHKAGFLHSPVIMIIIFSLFVYQLILTSVPSVLPRVLGFASSIPVEEVIKLTNQKRVEAGLTPLNTNPILQEAAQAKAADMLAHDYWAHVSPGGVTPWDFFRNFGYTYRFAGENLARDFANPSSVVDAWMASQSHKENIMSPKYEEIGVAVVEGDLEGVDTTLVVQFFGSRGAKVAQAEEVVKERGVKPEPQIEGQYLASAPILSPLDSTKGLSAAVLGLLLGVFLVDEIIVYRKKIFRVSGRGVAHMSFLGMILLVVLIIKSGQIL